MSWHYDQDSRFPPSEASRHHKKPTMALKCPCSCCSEGLWHIVDNLITFDERLFCLKWFGQQKGEIWMWFAAALMFPSDRRDAPRLALWKLKGSLYILWRASRAHTLMFGVSKSRDYKSWWRFMIVRLVLPLPLQGIRQVPSIYSEAMRSTNEIKRLVGFNSSNDDCTPASISFVYIVLCLLLVVLMHYLLILFGPASWHTW